ncbi:fungal-specific transcription factor domain-containing protein [Aspergillus pseudodeflectus]|uniref:Fungal-specific transcription factor domain-containing protein n=1 Tax=Aspergillus pseudodeflectus TaxID=176178 RepID=A0ABR4KD76_9EURO
MPKVTKSPLRSSLHANRSCRACDGCKVRKVKCDLATPKCSSCIAVDINCTFTAPVRKRGPRPTRLPAPCEPVATINVESSYGARLTESRAAVSLPDGPNQSPLSGPGLSILPTSAAIASTGDFEFDIVAIGKALLCGLGSPDNVDLLDEIMTSCSTAFFDKFYALDPLVHRNTFDMHCRQICHTLRQHLLQGASLPTPLPAAKPLTPINFAVVTAVCAKTLLMSPSENSTSDPQWREPMFQASRKALALYSEFELENPTSGSIVARYIQTGYLHHIGKRSQSWLILGEAMRFAEVLNLHQKQAYEGDLDPWERELRSRLFWILYTADRSAGCIMRRVSSFCVNEAHEIDVPFPDESFDCAYSRESNGDPTELVSLSPIVGFNLNSRLWRQADLLFRELLYLRHRCTVGNMKLEAQDYARIRQLHIAFETCLDSAPAAFQLPVLPLNPGSPHGGLPSGMIAVQSANIHVSFQCVRMRCLYAMEELCQASGLNYPWGLVDISLTKIELARQMIQVVNSVSIESIKANGESCAEKIRLTGAALLDVINGDSDPALIARAEAHLATVIHILTSLNSKAVDAVTLEKAP